ncbi:cysteine desulfurase family protein [Desulfonatronovibrio hydrogenovorans]|uniref:cysteine desulfurase family protein n=1 Tax=Desulfonatronovibrio hydrogenovorans TaxID=53245 RepID=UPI00048C7B11|nr:cysteine desulfurase family protein [Desulfonatronovibrio hydrogenovorans]
MKPLYFDYNATTPVHKDVVQAMLPYFTDKFGNPGCGHMHGLEARRAVDLARQNLARLIKAGPDQVYFTSCATESNNLVLSGLLEPGHELIISAVEHPSISQPAHELVKKGIILKIAPVNKNGLVDPDQVLSLVTDKTRLISIMLANNEVGTIQPVAEIASRLEPQKVLLHTDAAQAVGKIEVDVNELGVDFLTLAGHKMYAPKGVGALFMRQPGLLKPLFFGGGQEKGLRPGTENIPYLAGLGRAARLAEDLDQEAVRQQALGKAFITGLARIHPDFVLHAEKAPRLPGTMSIGFRGCLAGDILSGMIASSLSASAGAACHGNTQKMSSVLQAMKVDPDYGLGTIRFSWGRMTSEQDIKELLTRLDWVFKEFLRSRAR